MIIRKELYRYKSSNRNFIAIWECEHCGHRFVGKGYSDGYFFNVVIPNAVCPKCKSKSSNSNDLRYISDASCYIHEDTMPKWQRALARFNRENE